MSTTTQWDGLPPNPAQGGYHWMEASATGLGGGGWPEVWLWRWEPQYRRWRHHHLSLAPESAGEEGWTYLFACEGPTPPDSVAAEIEKAARAARIAALREAAQLCADAWRAQDRASDALFNVTGPAGSVRADLQGDALRLMEHLILALAPPEPPGQ